MDTNLFYLFIYLLPVNILIAKGFLKQVNDLFLINTIPRLYISIYDI